MTLEQFYKRLKEHGLTGYNFPGSDTIRISKKGTVGDTIKFPKGATSWEDVDIIWPIFFNAFLSNKETVLQLVSDYLQDNKKQSDNARCCLACPTSDHRYITDINSDWVFDCLQNTEMRFVFSTSDEPRWYSADELETLKNAYPLLAPSIEAMKVKE